MPIFSFIGNILQELFEKLATDSKYIYIYIETNSNFYTSNDVCFQNKVLRMKSNSCAMFKAVSLEVHTSVKVYGRAI